MNWIWLSLSIYAPLELWWKKYKKSMSILAKSSASDVVRLDCSRPKAAVKRLIWDWRSAKSLFSLLLKLSTRVFNELSPATREADSVVRSDLNPASVALMTATESFVDEVRLSIL